jgi:hypothetical protein
MQMRLYKYTVYVWKENLIEAITKETDYDEIFPHNKQTLHLHATDHY